MTGVVLCGLFTLLTLAHGAMPTELVHDNMVRSLAVLDEEGNYPNIGLVIGDESFQGFAGQGNQIDNFSNKWMIQSVDVDHYADSAEYDEDIPYDEARRAPVPGSLGARAFSTGWEDGNYWSGYRIYLKPLLMLMRIRGIRIVQAALVALSLVLAARAVCRHIGCGQAWLLVVAVLLINPANTLVNLDQAPDLMQALLSVPLVLYLLERFGERQWLGPLFLALGMVEAFVNCLIMPLVTLGLPLCAYVMRRMRDAVAPRMLAGEVAQASVGWGVGYAWSYVGVWVVSALFKGTSPVAAIGRGIGAFLYRAGGEEASLVASIVRAVRNNVDLNVPLVWVLLATVALLAVHHGRSGRVGQLVDQVPLAVVGLYPFAWVIVLSNHSFHHSWMAHDIFCIFLWAEGCVLWHLLGGGFVGASPVPSRHSPDPSSPALAADPDNP